MFHTKVEIPNSSIKITYQDHIMTFGSCFAENIGKMLKSSYFDIDLNPFGVLYNPISIKNSLELLLTKDLFVKNDLFQNKSLWQSFSHSSYFSDISANLCLGNINDRFLSAKRQLKKSKILIITFGTAWVYEDQESGRIVSNCHKLPSNAFKRRRLTSNEIVDSFTQLINQLKVEIEDLQLIFSVSPIRHWKDGAHENNISKSVLLMAISSLQDRFSNIHYFPAYEIQLDELRDYRFYAADMLHPSEVAINYIWERFSETYFSTETRVLIKKLEQLNADLNHRPIKPQSEEFLRFTENTESRKRKLLEEYPFLQDRLNK